jgi:hypothetical protein
MRLGFYARVSIHGRKALGLKVEAPVSYISVRS